MKLFKLLSIALILCFSLVGVGQATTYCLRADGTVTAADKANATSCAAVASAMNITQHNAATFTAGDTITLCDTGGEFKDATLTPPTSGSVGSIITYNASGTPIINGSDVVATWTSELQGGTDFTSDENLQGYWYFDNSWNDGTVNANHLTAAGGPPTFDNTAGEFIQGTYSAKFVAATSDVASRAEASLAPEDFLGKTGASNTDFTVAIWARTSAATTTQGIFNKGPTSSAPFILAFMNTGYIRFISILDVDAQVLTSDSTISADTWYHIVGRFTSSTKKLEWFVNNTKQASYYDATSTTQSTNASPLRIGYDSTYGYLTGMTDEAVVFNRALLDVEVSSLYTFGLDGTRNATLTLYYKTGLTQPHAVYENSSPMAVSATKGAMTSKSFWWDSDNTRLYIYPTADADPATKTIEVGARTGIDTNSKNYLTIDGLKLTKFYSNGIVVTGTNTTIQNCTLDTWEADDTAALAGNGNGITIQASNATVKNNVLLNGVWGITSYAGSAITDSILIQGNTVHDIQGNCINPSGSASYVYTNVVTEHNTVYNCAQRAAIGSSYGIAYGAYASGAGNIVRFNKSYNNGSATSEAAVFGSEGTSSDGVKFFYNIGYGTYGSCFTILASANTVIENNTCYNNEAGGFGDAALHFVGGANNATVKNNIFDATAANWIVKADSGASTGHVFDNNLYYGGSATPFYWPSSSYSFTNWKTALGGCPGTGRDCSSINADPLFVSTSDFHLQAGSPAINAGVDIGLATDYAGRPIQSAPDIGAFETEIRRKRMN